MKEDITDDEIVFALAMKYDNDLEKVADAMMNNRGIYTWRWKNRRYR